MIFYLINLSTISPYMLAHGVSVAKPGLHDLAVCWLTRVYVCMCVYASPYTCVHLGGTYVPSLVYVMAEVVVVAVVLVISRLIDQIRLTWDISLINKVDQASPGKRTTSRY